MLDKFHRNSTICKKSEVGLSSSQQSSYEKFATYTTYILGFIGVLIEAVQLISIKSKYIQWGNLLDWFTYTGSILVVINFTECGAREVSVIHIFFESIMCLFIKLMCSLFYRNGNGN